MFRICHSHWKEYIINDILGCVFWWCLSNLVTTSTVTSQPCEGITDWRVAQSASLSWAVCFSHVSHVIISHVPTTTVETMKWQVMISIHPIPHCHTQTPQHAPGLEQQQQPKLICCSVDKLVLPVGVGVTAVDLLWTAEFSYGARLSDLCDSVCSRRCLY